jgi:NADH-quinone oxidoreductase subunit E
MLETEPVGRNSVSICTNISCMLCGADKVVKYVEEKLGVKMGETTADGRIFLKVEEECVAACTGAPMMIVNGHYHEKLTEEKIDEILDGLE